MSQPPYPGGQPGEQPQWNQGEWNQGQGNQGQWNQGPPQPYGQQPYQGYPPPNYGPPPKQGNALAIWALVLGIVALLLCWTIVGGIGLGLIALILGLIAWSRSRRDNRGGGGMAITGGILGVLAIAASIFLVFIGIGIFKWLGGDNLVDCLDRAGSDLAAQQRCQDEFQSNIEDRFSVTIPPPPTR
ncbi:MAG TPA: DUF4190 domain-containing protein [Aldersonia sp.]